MICRMKKSFKLLENIFVLTMNRLGHLAVKTFRETDSQLTSLRYSILRILRNGVTQEWQNLKIN